MGSYKRSIKKLNMTSVDQIIQSINESCRNRGGKYKQYSCKTVSWDDVQRGTVGGGLSCWGSNITDTYLKAKDGTQLFTVRPCNWNEKLGAISTDDVALVQGNQNRGNKQLSPITLATFLKNAKKYGSYAGLKSDDLSKTELDKKCSIRFQTTFLPVDDKRHANMQFATEAYNYNTRSDDDPRNMILLCTTQGLALQQDGEGTKRVLHHNVEENGVIKRYWLEAERSEHKVGGQQKESTAEKEDALKRGKATSSVIGIKAMGTRFNVLMTVQIPLAQKPTPARSACYNFGPSFGGGSISEMYCDSFSAPVMCMSAPMGAPMPKMMMKSTGVKECRSRSKRAVGSSNASRVSRGDYYDTWSGLNQTEPKRNDGEHITVTVVFYNTVAGGVPCKEDVMAAIDDMENLYQSCQASGRLADEKFDFMKSELTVKDCQDITAKVVTQPHQSPSKPPGVTGFDTFPTTEN